MISRTVTPSESGKRLHRYVRILMPNYPLGQIYKMIEQGKVRVNGKRKKDNYELSAGDELTIMVDEETYRQSAGEEKKLKFIGVKTNIDVVYEDDALLIVNKPAGLLTHPDQMEQKDTLITMVHAYLYRKDQLDSQLFLPAAANRLDRNTSGLVLVGKTAGMLHQLNQWVQKRQIGKYYVTLVQGKLTGKGTIDAALSRDMKSNRTRVSDSDTAKEAVTHYEALTSANGYTLVEVDLESGRTHQIRSHFQSIGHPVLGDVKYGGRPYEGVNHQLLHAWKITLPDERAFTASPPSLFGSILRKLQLTLPQMQD
jgi:RluA family pseudouridine synthase